MTSLVVESQQEATMDRVGSRWRPYLKQIDHANEVTQCIACGRDYIYDGFLGNDKEGAQGNYERLTGKKTTAPVKARLTFMTSGVFSGNHRLEIWTGGAYDVVEFFIDSLDIIPIALEPAFARCSANALCYEERRRAMFMTGILRANTGFEIPIAIALNANQRTSFKMSMIAPITGRRELFIANGPLTFQVEELNK